MSTAIAIAAVALLVLALMVLTFSSERENSVWEGRRKGENLDLQLLRQQERDDGFIRQIVTLQERLQKARREIARLGAYMPERGPFGRRPRRACLALAWTRRRLGYRRILLLRLGNIVQPLDVSPEYSLKETDT